MIKITWNRNGYWTKYPKKEWEKSRDEILTRAERLNLKPLKIVDAGGGTTK